MARTALTVTTINNGTSGSIVELTGLLSAANADGHSFANGTDRRTFVVIKNASGAQRTITFSLTLTVNTNGGDAVTFDEENLATEGVSSSTIENGETRLFGPFRPAIYNQTDATVHVDFDSATSVTCAAFKLPWFRDTGHGAHSIGTGNSPTVDTLTTQQITPHGIAPTFTAHSQAAGYYCPLDSALRRFIWLKNASGGNITIVQRQTSGVDETYAVRLSDADSDTIHRRYHSDTIADTEEWFLGPFHPAVWDDSGSREMLLRGTSGPHANLSAAWLEITP